MKVRFCKNFDEDTKIDKAYKDAYNRGEWLILLDLLNEWVAKGVTSDLMTLLSSSRVMVHNMTMHSAW